MLILKFLVVVLIGIVIAFFLIVNTNTVDLTYFIDTSIKLPLSAIICASFLSGFIFVFIISTFEKFKLKSEMRKKNKKILKLEEELESIRHMPKNVINECSNTN